MAEEIIQKPSSGSLKDRQKESLQKKKKARKLKKYKNIITEGILTKNPILVQLLGTCSTLAITTTIANGLGMGIAVIFVLTFSNFFISLLRNFIPSKIRIASYVVIISGFVTIVDMILKAYIPALSTSLGVFIPLIVVNCIILARAESFASKNDPLSSALDGLASGIGFTCALLIMCIIRDILGNGSIAGINIMGDAFSPALLIILPPGGFLILGSLIALVQYIMPKLAKKEEEKDD
ncbi:MAG: Electron transport complex protein RnfE [Clostridia bacterium]|jgi:electron transport complex protein RnfE|nr:Electron transport complex protein RnfE [Clostridia bacterium]